MEDDEDEELIGEEGAELIGADDAAPAKKAARQVPAEEEGQEGKYGEAGLSGAKRRFGGRRMSTSTRAAAGGGDVVDPDEPMLYATTGAAAAVRHGAVAAERPLDGAFIGMHLHVFAGGDESISFNDVHTLHVGNLTWTSRWSTARCRRRARATRRRRSARTWWSSAASAAATTCTSSRRTR